MIKNRSQSVLRVPNRKRSTVSVSWWDLRGSWNLLAIERERKTSGKKLQGEDRQVAEEQKLWTKAGPVRRSAINQPLFGENCKQKAPRASVEEARSHKALVSCTSFLAASDRPTIPFLFSRITRAEGGDRRKEKHATVRGGKARKLCSEQDTMVLR